MNMHGLSAGIDRRASRFRDGSRSARCCRVNPVAIQRDLQESSLHYLRQRERTSGSGYRPLLQITLPEAGIPSKASIASGTVARSFRSVPSDDDLELLHVFALRWEPYSIDDPGRT